MVTIARVFCCFPTDKLLYWNRSLSAVSCTAEATRVAQEEKVPREQEPMQAAGGAVTLYVERKYRQKSQPTTEAEMKNIKGN